MEQLVELRIIFFFYDILYTGVKEDLIMKVAFGQNSELKSQSRRKSKFKILR